MGTRLKAPACFVTRDEFVAAVGTVNADLTFTRRTTVRYATRYALLAGDIAFKAARIGAKVLHTITDDGLHVVTIKGFGSHMADRMTPGICPACGGRLELVRDGRVGVTMAPAFHTYGRELRYAWELRPYLACSACEYCTRTLETL